MLLLTCPLFVDVAPSSCRRVRVFTTIAQLTVGEQRAQWSTKLKLGLILFSTSTIKIPILIGLIRLKFIRDQNKNMTVSCHLLPKLRVRKYDVLKSRW